MARYVCPSCGAGFDGRKCRACAYVHFSEEISHGLHTHRGEPLVIRGTQRRRIPKADPFGCDPGTRTRRRSGKKSPIGLILVLVLALGAPVMDILETAAQELESLFTPQRETVPQAVLPEDVVILFRQEGLTVYWDGMIPQEGSDAQLFVRNDTGTDLRVTGEDITVNGYLMDTCYLYCEAPEGQLTAGWLRLEEEDLQITGITRVEGISFRLEFLRREDYEPVCRSQVLTLGSQPAGELPRVEDIPLVETEDLAICYVGYLPSSYEPESFCDGKLLFYLENNTDRPVVVRTVSAWLNGAEVDTALWCRLPANSRTVCRVYLYDLEGLALPDSKNLTLELEVSDDSTYETILEPRQVEIAIRD